uniref:C2 NT-type domain-containing protein n=1 Tax=Chenopodium quinoa TaxID=63459 RepID=A0A803LSN9_CHEQI
MVLGTRNKYRRGPSIQVDYVIHIQDIKPWPPTQSLKTVRSVLIQWENGERNSGSTSSVAPSIEDGKILINESFRVPVTLSRDLSVKSGDADMFHKNLLKFNLYEPRRDKTVKGQLLGTAIVDLADYGVIKEVMSLSVPMNCTRSFRNTAQPILYFRIQAYDKVRSGISLRGRLAKETSLDKNEGDSISALMSEEYADEAEVASFTDDDFSSHSSLTALSALESNGASPSQNETGLKRGKSHTGMQWKTMGKPYNVSSFLSDTSELDSELNLEKLSSASHKVHETSQKFAVEVDGLKGQTLAISTTNESPPISTAIVIPVELPAKLKSEHDYQIQATRESEQKSKIPERKFCIEVAPTVDFDGVDVKDRDKNEKNDQAGGMLEVEKHILGNASYNKLSLDATKKQVLSGSELLLIRDRVRHVRSVRSSTESSRGSGPTGGFSGNILRQEANPAEKVCTSSDDKLEGLGQRIEILERELREAAALEVSLYSVVAEHGSSINKVHAPARRLSRLYLQAGTGMKRASAAQSAVSGLIVVAKACGNDVPRLTFWLSNCVALRAILTEAFSEEQLPVSASSLADIGIRKGINQKSTVLKWKVSSSDKQANKFAVNGSSQDWVDPYAFMSALEKVESWIFSRVVESVWWQTLTPHMQSSAAQMIEKVVDSGFQKKYRRSSSSSDEEQVNFSLELWKKAFKDACERLCPIRAGGHECGCLPVLAKLIMEQCVARLDVAMFNAILRESADDIPTDPVSDPITFLKVLPVPAGRSSFGSGAQLKNAVCPSFGAHIIKRILENFVSDEFCSDKIPAAVFEALDAQSVHDEDEGSIMNCPCTAPVVSYSPPTPYSLASALGVNLGRQSPSQLLRSGSVLRRSNTSDDKLDELDSPLQTMLSEGVQSFPAQVKENHKMLQNHQNNVIRYQLLRKVWDEVES